MLSLSCFLDDLDGYQYHRTNYPQNMMAFLNKVNLMNDIRFMPWFFDFTSNITSIIKQNTNFGSNWNQIYVEYEDYVRESDPNKVYFLNSISDFYTLTLLQNIAMFLVLKGLHLLFYLLRNFNICKMAYLKFSMETQWWTFLLMLFEANIVNLSFSCASQMVTPSFFGSYNKLNFALMALFLFSLLVYSLCFYSLMRQYALNSYI